MTNIILVSPYTNGDSESGWCLKRENFSQKSEKFFSGIDKGLVLVWTPPHAVSTTLSDMEGKWHYEYKGICYSLEDSNVAKGEAPLLLVYGYKGDDYKSLYPIPRRAGKYLDRHFPAHALMMYEIEKLTARALDDECHEGYNRIAIDTETTTFWDNPWRFE